MLGGAREDIVLFLVCFVFLNIILFFLHLFLGDICTRFLISCFHLTLASFVCFSTFEHSFTVAFLKVVLKQMLLIIYH